MVNVNKLYIESLVMQTDLCFCSPTGYRDAFLSWQNDRGGDYMWQLRGGLKHVLSSPLLGEMIQVD